MLTNAIVLVAPGPSANAKRVRQIEQFGLPVAAVSTAYKLCSKPLFIAASDGDWWRVYNDVPPCKHYTMCPVYLAPLAKRVHQIKMTAGVVNSGVLALEVARRLNYRRIYLYGFDMHGTHFFGRYTNGLKNTQPKRRAIHLQQYADWRKSNPELNIVNITKGSALTCFERGCLWQR